MTTKLTKTGMMMVAAVLLVAIAFAGAASADYVEVGTWDELKNNVTGWNDKTNMRTIVVTASINKPNSESANYPLTVNGNITISPVSTAAGEISIDALGKLGLFDVIDGATLHLCGNDTATLKLTGTATCGAIIGHNSAVVIISDGVNITNCSSSNGGAGIGMESNLADKYPLLIMNGGNISYCNTTGNMQYCGGGAVRFFGQGTFIMNGGTISDCYSTDGGYGAVMMRGSNNRFIMSGGIITNCYVFSTSNDEKGAGVTVGVTDSFLTAVSNSSLNISGNAIIAGNYFIKTGSSPINRSSNVFIMPKMDKGNKINIDGDFTGKVFIGNGSDSIGGIFGTAASSSFTGAENIICDSDYDLHGYLDGTTLKWKRDAYVEVATWDMFKTVVSKWTDKTNMRTIVVTDSFDCTETGPNYEGIIVKGNITVQPAADVNVTIDAKGIGRFFYITSQAGRLTLSGNGTGTLTFTDGKYLDSSYFGGAIYVYGGGNLLLSQGVNIRNSSSYMGGGVYVYQGNITLAGGNIINCTAYTNGGSDGFGGGVYVRDGNSNFVMTGGNIRDCRALNSGGGVFYYQYNGPKSFIMSGGMITNCSGNDGGGVKISMTAAFNFNISGNGKIMGNYNQAYTEDSNVVFRSGAVPINLVGNFDGKIYVKKGTMLEGNEIGFTDSAAFTGVKNIISDTDNTLMGSFNGTKIVWKKYLDPYVEVASWAQFKKAVEDWTYTEKMRTIVVTKSFDSTETGTDKSISLTGNVTILPASGVDVTIDAKEHGYFFELSSGSNLSLCGNGTGTLRLTGGKTASNANNPGAILVKYGANLMMSDGVTITNCSATNSGKIAAILVNGGARFTMSGGNITECNATDGTDSCTVQIAGTFNMTGGSITNCNASNVGGVKITSSYDFNVGGNAKIIGNTNSSSSLPSNVYLYNAIQLNLVSDFTGKIGICNPAPVAEGIFGRSLSASYTGAENFVADTNKKFSGSLEGTDLKWVLSPTIEVSTWSDFVNATSEWVSTTKQRTIILASSIDKDGTAGADGIEIKGNISIVSSQSAPGEIKFDANGNGRLFNVTAGGSLSLGGNVNLTGGLMSTGNGGAIMVNPGANLTISSDVKVTNSSAVYGGGVYVDGGSFAMIGGNITECNATYGGGIYVTSTDRVSLTGGNVTGNTATTMGAEVGTESSITVGGTMEIGQNEFALVKTAAGYPKIICSSNAFSGNVSSIKLYNETYAENPIIWLGQIIVKNGVPAKDHFTLTSYVQGSELKNVGNDLVLDFPMVTVLVMFSGSNAGHDAVNLTLSPFLKTGQTYQKDVGTNLECNITGVVGGTYTLTATYTNNSMVHNLMKEVIVSGDKSVFVDFELIGKNVTTEVKTDKGTASATPNIAVYDLDKVAKAQNPGDGETITISFTAEGHSASESTDNQTMLMNNRTHKEGTPSFMNFTVTNTTTFSDGTNITTFMTSVGNNLTIYVEYDTVNRENIEVLRIHDGIVENFSKVDQKPMNPKDRTFFLGTSGIYIYSQKFSDYLISSTAKATPSTPTYSGSGNSHNYGGSMLLKEGEVAPNPYATAQPTVAPTAKPTAAPVYDTPTAAPTAQPTQSQKSPAPFAGLIAGLGIAALFLRLRK